MASKHYFDRSKWQLPTQEHYLALQRLFNAEGRQPPPPFTDYHPAGSPFVTLHERGEYAYLRGEYAYLRGEYEELRGAYEELRGAYEELRRPFTLSPGVPYTDCWSFATVPAQPGKHPCEKPQALLRHLITVSSRPGDTVLDCCAGSFATLQAAKDTGRCGIGIEVDPRWYRHGIARLGQESLFVCY